MYPMSAKSWAAMLHTITLGTHGTPQVVMGSNAAQDLAFIGYTTGLVDGDRNCFSVRARTFTGSPDNPTLQQLESTPNAA